MEFLTTATKKKPDKQFMSKKHTFATNARVFVYVHGLHHGWLPEAQLPADCLHAVAVCVASEDGVLKMQGVANLGTEIMQI